jgi:hypothetical protein
VLDAYIIDRIRRERERREERSRAQTPLHVPEPPPDAPERGQRRQDEDGEAVVDYRI